MALLWLLCHSTTPVIAAPAERPLSDATPFHYVAATGADSGDCSTPVSACLTIQYAVDQAGTDDEIRVASGVYTGTATQVVVITKSITIRGGYTTTNDFADPSDPVANPTTLDAEGQRRVLYATGDISPTIEGLRLTGGDATGLGGGTGGTDAGGGVYVITATATISNNQVFNNTADYGGGLFLDYSNATLSDNTITSNTASGGGGLSLNHSNATLSGNTVVSNTATADYGGGLSAYGSDATLISNTITSNTAQDGGGGLFLYESDATLNGNEVISNTARWGGGLYLDSGSDATLNGNTITSNNVANEGGGLYLGYSDVTLTNTVVADNQADTVGGGLYILASSPRLLHTTITHNSSGDGSGIYVNSVESYYSTVALTNTILVSHTVGISVTGGNTVTANGILWYSTLITISQAAEATVTVQNQYQGDPAFAADGYHLAAGSAAIDKGVEAGVTTDIDGASRPAGRYPDLGADEFPAALGMTKEQDQTVVSGSDVTFTITISNTGYLDLSNVTVTDAEVPDCAQTIGDLGVGISRTYTCTVASVTASFTNTATVTGTSPAGPVTDTDTATVTVADIEITKTPDTQTVASGSAATFTITISNTGDAVLTDVEVTDALVPDCERIIGDLDATEGTSYTCQVVNATVSFTNTATVIGTSPAGPVTDTDTATVTVEEAIGGLTANNDSPTPLGSATTLTATITDGSNVTYTWAFGHDGATGSGAVVTHIYPAIDTYTAVVTASNSISMDTATTTVTIVEAPILNLYLPIILKNYTPPSVPPTETPTPTVTGTLPPTATPTPTATPIPTGPDLVVTGISVVPNPPEAGQPATVYVTVRNQGNQPVTYGNNFYVDFYVDSVPEPGLVGDIQWGAQGSWFGAGESRTLNSSYTFTTGDHQLYAQADTDNSVAETNENNNTYGPVSLTVTSLEGGEAPVGPVVIPTPGGGSPRPTPTPEP